MASSDRSEFLLAVAVVGELRYGALNPRKADENLTGVERLQLKAMGKPIPENDLWIAASCVDHGVKLTAAPEREGRTLVGDAAHCRSVAAASSPFHPLRQRRNDTGGSGYAVNLMFDATRRRNPRTCFVAAPAALKDQIRVS